MQQSALEQRLTEAASSSRCKAIELFRAPSGSAAGATCSRDGAPTTIYWINGPGGAAQTFAAGAAMARSLQLKSDALYDPGTACDR
jgi:hypothetical protein